MTSAVVVGVYRSRNAAVLDEVLAPAREAGFEIRLWALDDAERRLDPWTLGSGAGGKFALVNRLRAAGDLGDRALVVADDDFRFARGTIVDFLSIARRCGFDLAQPAHDRRSFATYPITRAKPFTLARETTFVEIGPLFAVSPPWLSRVTPFPEVGMGWGLELEWVQLQREGCRLGIVDETRIRHLAPVAEGYDAAAEREREREKLEELGVASYAEVQNTLRRWLRRPVISRRRRSAARPLE